MKMKNVINDIWKTTIEGNLGINLKKDAVEIRLLVTKDVYNNDLLSGVLQVRGFQKDTPRIVNGEDTTKIALAIGEKGVDIGNLVNNITKKYFDNDEEYQIVSQCTFDPSKNTMVTDCEEGYVNNANEELVIAKHKESKGLVKVNTVVTAAGELKINESEIEKDDDLKHD